MNGSHTHDCVLCQFTSIAFIGGSLLAVTAIFCFAQRPQLFHSRAAHRRAFFIAGTTNYLVV